MARVISAVLTLKDKDFSKTAKSATRRLTETEREALKAKNTVTKFGKSARTGFKQAAKGAASIAGAVGIVKGLSAAFGMVRGSLDSAFGRMDTMEQFNRTMTELTGSADAAQSALDATNEAVKGTAYGLDTAAKSVQDFVTRGMDVEKATNVVAAWGDAVAFYGDGSNEQLASVTDALAKMSTKGKVEMDQLNRLFDVGIDAVGMYAKATGQSSSDVQDALSAGEISSEQFIDTVTKAMTEGTNGVTNIAGAAKEAGASWSGSFANMRAAVARGVTNVIQSIDEMLTSNGLPDMRGMVANLGETFEKVLTKAGDMVPVVTGYLVDLYDKSKPGIDWIKDTGLPAIKDGFQGAVDAVKDMYNFVKDNWALIGPIVAGVAAGVASFRIGVMAVTAATRIWGTVTAAVTVATKVLNGTLRISPLGWVAMAIGLVVTAGVALYKNWDYVSETASKLWKNLKKWFGDLKNSIVKWWGNVIDKGVELWQGFIGIKDKAVEMAIGVKDGIVDMKDKVVDWFGELKDGAVEKFDEIVQAAKDLPGKIGQGIKDFAADAWEGITNLASGLIDKFKETLGIASPSKVFYDMAHWIVEGLVNGLNAENLKELGKSVFKGFAGGVFDTFEKIKGFFTGSGAGGNVQSWIAQAMAITGVPASWKSALETIAMKESGGNPSAFNDWDINAQRGTPSMGLMQTIRPTFDAYKLPGMNDILNPVHNAVAAIRYIQSRYGTVFNTPGIRSMAAGGGYRGYWRGGTVPYGQRILVGERGPELIDVPGNTKVHNNQETKRMMGSPQFGDIIINGVNLTTDQIASELVTKIKLRLANM